MSAAPQRIALHALPARPWKNGGGVTREIAAAPTDAALDRFDWRLSVAEVAQDGPFSAFEGIDRTIVLGRGAGMTLHGADGPEHRLDRAGIPFACPGEARVSARLIDGPTLDLNVMTRRGVWRADVRTVHAASNLEAAGARLVLCGAGTWRLAGTALTIDADAGLLWQAPCGTARLEPAGGDGAWAVVVQLCHDPAP